MSMRPRSLLIALAVATTAATAGEARAQDWQWEARGTVTTGVSDNVLNSEDTTSPDQPGPVTDVFLQLQPSADAEYASPRTRVRAQYAFNAFIYQDTGDANALSHHLALTTTWLSTPRSDVSLNVSGDAGKTTTLLLNSEGGGDAQLVPNGERTFRAASAAQRWSWRATRRLRLSEELRVRASRTYTEGMLQDLGSDGAIAFRATWARPRSRLGGMVELRAFDLERRMVLPTDTATAATEINGTARGIWQRDWTPKWASVATAGVTITDAPSPSFTDRLRPVAEVEITNTRWWGATSLTIGRSVDANLLVARKSIGDWARITTVAGLPWLRRNPQEPVLVATGSTSVYRGRGIDLETGETNGRWTAFGLDARIAWQVSEQWHLALHYAHRTQSGDDALASSYSRNALMLSVSAHIGRRRTVSHRLPTQARDAARTPGQFTDD